MRIAAWDNQYSSLVHPTIHSQHTCITMSIRGRECSRIMPVPLRHLIKCLAPRLSLSSSSYSSSSWIQHTSRASRADFVFDYVLIWHLGASYTHAHTQIYCVGSCRCATWNALDWEKYFNGTSHWLRTLSDLEIFILISQESSTLFLQTCNRPAACVHNDNRQLCTVCS